MGCPFGGRIHHARFAQLHANRAHLAAPQFRLSRIPAIEPDPDSRRASNIFSIIKRGRVENRCGATWLA